KEKKEKTKKKFLFFGKNKKTQDIEEQTEDIQEENTAHTYINDSDFVNIKEVEIYGNNLLETNYIKEQMSSREGEQYVRSEVSNDLKALYATGYFTKNLRALPIKMDENNIKLRVIVEENPPVHGFILVGNDSISTSELMTILAPYERQPQNILSLNTAISEIQDLYSSRGYIVAKVSKVVDDPDGYVYIYIDEGIIGDIIVEGNNKTKDFIVKRNIFLQPGCVYNENTLRSDILRLMGTQAFKDVQRELVQDENTGLYDVYVMLEEQRTGRVSIGVGIDSASGFFGSVGFSENNFRGLGQKLNLNIMAGTGILMNDSSIVRKPTLQGEISFLEPMFKRENQSLSIRGFGRYYGSYQVPLAIERRIGGEVTIARQFVAFKNLSGSIGLGAEHVNITEGNLTEARAQFNKAGIPWSRRREELDDGFYLKITPALTYDTRDSAVNARHGLIARASFEENIGIGAKTFGKLSGTIKKFIPFGKKSSIVIAGKAGGKIHGTVPEFAGYSLGGPYTIRGFNISEVGVGDGYMMGSAEVRVPIPFIDKLTSNSFLNNIRIAGFVDAGTLFNKSLGTKLYNKPGYAISAGVGLRIFVPGLGPINLDYGIPLTNTYSVKRSGGFFTFGMGEMY
ncbi:BamA/TamA family outer membrane protein, partial [bacterium]|nr:BamA/TamA family outer membrane protein [bacterium]